MVKVYWPIDLFMRYHYRSIKNASPAVLLRQAQEVRMNLQVIASTDEDILWVSGALPGSPHDKKANWV